MKAQELIGKEVIRTKPIMDKREISNGILMVGTTIQEVPDYSYCNSPILIVNATDTHIAFKSKSFDNEYRENVRILDCRFCDDNWTDYQELINPNVKSFMNVETIE